jgi:hypothetical protein
MTEKHPITPPAELVQQWVAEIWHEGTPVRVALSDEHIATRAAQWGADQELESIIELAGQQLVPEEDRYLDGMTVASIRAARRPKPPGLKEQALEKLREVQALLQFENVDTAVLRRALEALPE